MGVLRPESRSKVPREIIAASRSTQRVALSIKRGRGSADKERG
jgi:hypothetical protein